eukprot:CAMPEP_0171263124 /NCGR_PEP_ID=MMETSP0790-20130122/56930_1 /TAXON_ID=2925 /ORGANISM="Alexandrium catenella, Strain OF101" /LENGTH=481 /DNA_ID=CAMNT_0011731717 /DNA_START=28 /DNA_END=1473 /DNA_ORIENTATION=+
MVCASSLASVLPAGPQMAWMHSVRSADWSQKDDFAGNDPKLWAPWCSAVTPVEPEPPALMTQVAADRSALAEPPVQQMPECPLPDFTQGAAGGFIVQAAPGQLQPVPIMCHGNGQPQQQAAAWLGYLVPVQEYPLVLNCQQAVLQPELGQPPMEQLEQLEQQTASALSTSAKRRLRRHRASQLRAQAPAEASELSSSTSCSALGDGSTEPIDCAALTEALEAGGEERMAALSAMRGSVARLAFEREGCRCVQASIHSADLAASEPLVGELRGRALDAVYSQYANYVIQAVITDLPTAMSSFVVGELLGSGVAVARHRFGCRILCRLIEHSSGGEDLVVLVEELLAEAGSLCRHPFAHYVVETMLEHLPECRQRIVQALRADLWVNACHRSGSHVVEAALAYGAEADRRALALQLLGSGRDSTVSLAQSPYGSFVLKALLKVPGKLSEDALAHLLEAAAWVEGTRCGQRLLEDVGLRAVAEE